MYQNQHNFVVCFTDGAVYHNGQSDAQCGVGVYWGVPKSRFNLSKLVRFYDAEKRTNQRAELHAIISALEIALDENVRQLTIYSDSRYAINCATIWSAKWKQNGWKTIDNRPVKNKTDIVLMDKLLSEFTDFDAAVVEFKHIDGHSECSDFFHIGNRFSDYLANYALRDFREIPLKMVRTVVDTLLFE